MEEFIADVMPMNLRVVVNRNAVTSRGPETAIEFALGLVERLYGKEKMEEVIKLLYFSLLCYSITQQMIFFSSSSMQSNYF